MPALPPDRTTELFHSGVWNNISFDMRDTSSVTITRGVGAEGNRPAPTAATAVLDNRSGDYSPRNPHSDLYGKVGRNTPWRFAVEAGGPWVNLPDTGNNALTTPDHAALAVTGDLDLRIDVALDSWREEMNLVGRYESTGNQRSWTMNITSAGYLRFAWSPDGTLASVVTATATAPVPAHHGQRLCLRVTLDVNNGAGGKTVQFYYGRFLDGRWEPIGSPVVSAGTTSVFDGTEGIQFGSVPDYNTLRTRGHLHALQLRNGIGGTLVVDLDAGRDADPDDTSFIDATGLVWTTRDGATLTNSHIRMVGEVPAWPPSRDLSGNDRSVAITPTGIMRRLDAGNKPLASALQRFVLGNGHAIDCWPLTDGPQSQWANSLMGGNRLLPLGDSDTHIQWGQGDLGDWLEPVAAITKETAGAVRAPIPRAAAAATGWSVDIVRAGNGVDTGLVVMDHGTGTATDPRIRWTLVNQTEADPDTLRLLAQTFTDDTDTVYTLIVLGEVGLQDGRPHHLRLEVGAAPGSSTNWSLYLDGAYIGGGTEAFPVHAPATVTYEWNEVFATTEVTDLSIGYLTVWDAAGPFAEDVYEAYRGFIGEQAGARVLRVADERGVPASMYGLPENGTLLGVQRPEKFLDTLDTVARTDLGYVLERRDALELVYRGRHTLYNQDPVLVLDFAQGVISAPFKPLDDDKLTQNEVTASRDGGTSTTAVLDTGRMSVLDPPDGVGHYDVARTLSLDSDNQTSDHAYWRLHLGTYDGLRYTQVTVDLGNPRGYALASSLYRADVGDLLRLTNLPADYGGGSTDLLIRGYKEEIGPEKWTITFTCDPGSPWDVGVREDPVRGKRDTAGSTLTAPVTATATTLSVATPVGPLWTTAAGDMPILLQLGGETVSVTAISGATSPQTFTVIRSQNGITKTHAASAAISLARPTVRAL